MVKSKNLKPLVFWFDTQIINFSINDDLVKIVLKLPEHINIDLHQLHNMLRSYFNTRSSHSHTFGSKSQYFLFIGF